MAPPRGFPPPVPLKILDGHTSLKYEIATGITEKRNATRVATFLTVIGEEAVDMFITHSIRALKLITLKYPDLMPFATVEITHYTKIASHVFIM